MKIKKIYEDIMNRKYIHDNENHKQFGNYIEDDMPQIAKWVKIIGTIIALLFFFACCKNACAEETGQPSSSLRHIDYTVNYYRDSTLSNSYEKMVTVQFDVVSGDELVCIVTPECRYYTTKNYILNSESGLYCKKSWIQCGDEYDADNQQWYLDSINMNMVSTFMDWNVNPFGIVEVQTPSTSDYGPMNEGRFYHTFIGDCQYSMYYPTGFNQANNIHDEKITYVVAPSYLSGLTEFTNYFNGSSTTSVVDPSKIPVSNGALQTPNYKLSYITTEVDAGSLVKAEMITGMDMSFTNDYPSGTILQFKYQVRCGTGLYYDKDVTEYLFSDIEDSGYLNKSYNYVLTNGAFIIPISRYSTYSGTDFLYYNLTSFVRNNLTPELTSITEGINSITTVLSKQRSAYSNARLNLSNGLMGAYTELDIYVRAVNGNNSSAWVCIQHNRLNNGDVTTSGGTYTDYGNDVNNNNPDSWSYDSNDEGNKWHIQTGIENGNWLDQLFSGSVLGGFVDAIKSFVSSLISVLNVCVSGIGQIPTLIGSVFSFLPSWFGVLFACSLGVVILFRFLGR